MYRYNLEDIFLIAFYKIYKMYIIYAELHQSDILIKLIKYNLLVPAC